jgi:hypothetical protein
LPWGGRGRLRNPISMRSRGSFRDLPHGDQSERAEVVRLRSAVRVRDRSQRLLAMDRL